MRKLINPRKDSYPSSMESDNHPKTFRDLFASISIDAQNSIIYNEQLYLSSAIDICTEYLSRSLTESPLTIE